MPLNESHVEDAALSWFEELGYSVGHGPHLAPGEQSNWTQEGALAAIWQQLEAMNNRLETIENEFYNER